MAKSRVRARIWISVPRNSRLTSARSEARSAVRKASSTSRSPAVKAIPLTRNPITGADERLIEAAWGLGEAVVNGSVVPDRYRVSPSGSLIEFVPGHKDVKIWYGDGEGTIEVSVEDHLHAAPSLADDQIAGLTDLAERCRRVYGPDLDIEWAVGSDACVHLLQCRPITTL